MKRFINRAVFTIMLFMVLPVQAVDSVADFTLPDAGGKSHTLSEYSKSKAIVLMFIATQCPVSNAYNERMAQLSNEYRAKGITFLGINSNKQEDVEEIREHALKNEFQFPVLKDWKNIIADKLDAQVTPEIYVLDSKLNILYHGRIDDSRRASQVKSHDLRVTLDEILAGKPVTNKETKAFGCTIKRID